MSNDIHTLQVYYCSKACQTANWPIHRVACANQAAAGTD